MRLRTPLRSLQRSPDPFAGFGKDKEWEKKLERKGKGSEGKEGWGGEVKHISSKKSGYGPVRRSAFI